MGTERASPSRGRRYKKNRRAVPKCRRKHNKISQIYFFLTQSVEESDTHGRAHAEDLRALRRRSVGRRSSVRRSVLNPVRASAPVGRSPVVGAPLGARPVAPSPAPLKPSFCFAPARGAAAAFRPPLFGAAAGASLLSGLAPPGLLRSGLRAVASPFSRLPSFLCLACSGLRAVASPFSRLPSFLCLACSPLGVCPAVCVTFFYTLC